MVRQAILNIMTDRNMIINLAGKIKKAMITKKKKKKSKQDNLPTGTNNNVYILSDSIVKHVEGWKLKNSLRKKSNV